jgi:hypothetical protein
MAVTAEITGGVGSMVLKLTVAGVTGKAALLPEPSTEVNETMTGDQSGVRQVKVNDVGEVQKSIREVEFLLVVQVIPAVVLSGVAATTVITGGTLSKKTRSRG